MNGHCINIAISGLGLKSSDELKMELRNAIPDQYGINWINVADPNIDLLIINESFFETQSIQKILENKNFPFLKIVKDHDLSGSINNNTLYLPFNNKIEPLKQWVNLKLLNYLSHYEEYKTNLNNQAPSPLDPTIFRKMLNPENARLHLFDDHGTLAIIDTRSKIAWLEPTRIKTRTNHSFQYDFAMTADFVKVSRKAEYQLQDWLWNLVWNSPELNTLADDIQFYQTKYWPQPFSTQNRKTVLQLSACFIQGAQLSQIAKQLNLPTQIVKQFIAACIAAGNGEEILAAQSKFSHNSDIQNDENQGFLNKFFGKLRRRFGL
ncbi:MULTISPECIES: hypothetical protein [unclassified Acinetobacter]|uniref:hypothetical protein n=1 Tax=unclassified Acinetobacter TaxID=196816 RepID=UPI00190D9142|nr:MULTISPECIES: hypothetical protein [unclassified Acinetobacter]MBK0064417.1 hypothetical protein [Acinetobacter sp. S55]MBK0067778.1 hypothetical protein [Acinetobacter sp. S54]